ncbi:LPS assembly lipoprotein LptE [Pararhizobium sp. BT-229]|uniref:LPS assembly lipoprotein LptE n=1 Tax=Pararhizobium sp. BT-229 TaxID=2986923 RepID=UPI0021F69F86|nr:LPS assembly lipoprotein LptE [Pararhizobium sp. BT-229]MCV9967370.1 LPS assembly lipoprotein LptE [Pararhizobium sp. BT-229]
MSLSEKVQRYAQLMALGALAVLAACQVKPLYSDGPQGKPAKALASIEISEADNRVEQEVRNALIFLTSGGAGEPANPEYKMALNVTSDVMGVLYDQESDTAGAGRVVVKADYNLTRADTGETVRSGNRSAVALVDFPEQEFAKVRAKIDAEKRASKELAEIIRADIAAALGR